ncbi:triadin-like [Triplophysa dalaica]|uniref:triadin-like n=1 Tax=Triplophysa dalaica TaxID=1582913 RepID=UPI0024DF612C|nr:triadin-like [Triplophysa dalaica]
MEVRSSTTTTTIVESKNDVSSQSGRTSKRTMTDDLYSTFSSPMSWILVLALVLTWSAVAVIMFDLLDANGLEAHTLYCDDPCLPPGPQPHRVRKTLKDAGGLRGGISHDHMKPVSDAMEDSTDWITSILTFVTNLVAPEPEEHEALLHTEEF